MNKRVLAVTLLTGISFHAVADEPVDYMVMSWAGQDLRVNEIDGHAGILIGQIHSDGRQILAIKCHIAQPAGESAWIAIYSAAPKYDLNLAVDGIKRNIIDCDANGSRDVDQAMGVVTGVLDDNHWPLETSDYIGIIAGGSGWQNGLAEGVLQIKLGPAGR